MVVMINYVIGHDRMNGTGIHDRLRDVYDRMNGTVVIMIGFVAVTIGYICTVSKGWTVVTHGA